MVILQILAHDAKLSAAAAAAVSPIICATDSCMTYRCSPLALKRTPSPPAARVFLVLFTVLQSTIVNIALPCWKGARSTLRCMPASISALALTSMVMPLDSSSVVSAAKAARSTGIFHSMSLAYTPSPRKGSQVVPGVGTVAA